MASILKVDNMQGITAAKTVTVTVGASVTQSLEQGLVKFWYQVNQATPAITDSLNATSLTDNATGNGTVSITNVFANDDHATTAAAKTQGGYYQTVTIQNHAADSVNHISTNVSNNSTNDSEKIMIHSNGELS